MEKTSSHKEGLHRQQGGSTFPLLGSAQTRLCAGGGWKSPSEAQPLAYIADGSNTHLFHAILFVHNFRRDQEHMVGTGVFQRLFWATFSNFPNFTALLMQTLQISLVNVVLLKPDLTILGLEEQKWWNAVSGACFG